MAAILIVVLLAIALASLAYEVAVGHTSGFDNQVRNTVHHFATPALTTFMIVATRGGQPAVMWVLAAVGSVLLWRAGANSNAGMLIVAMAGGLLLDETLKFAFHRARPTAYFDYPLPHSYSFPSGHALFAACFFAAFASAVSPLLSRIWKKVLLWAAAITITGLIGISRVYLGVHYPTDVVGGYLAACMWVVVVAVSNRMRLRRIKPS